MLQCSQLSTFEILFGEVAFEPIKIWPNYFTNLDFPEIMGFPLLFTTTIWGEGTVFSVTIIWPDKDDRLAGKMASKKNDKFSSCWEVP